jgi:hypothetical protein
VIDKTEVVDAPLRFPPPDAVIAMVKEATEDSRKRRAVAVAGKPRPKIDRRAFKFVIFAGAGSRPVKWCTSVEEVNAFIKTVKLSKLSTVDVGTLQPVQVDIKHSFKG